MNSVAYKVALVGEAQAGKSAFLARLVKGSFSSRYQPTSVEFHSVNVELPHGQRVTLQLWDVGGGSAPALLRTYLAQSQAVLAMYDITSTQSFAGVLRWLDRAKAAAGAGLPYLALVACKSDLEGERTVTVEDHQHLAHTLGMYSYSTSSLTGDGVKACAYRVAADLAGTPLSAEQLEALAGPSRELPARGATDGLALPHPSTSAATFAPPEGAQSLSNSGKALAPGCVGGGGAAYALKSGGVSSALIDFKRRPMLSRGAGGTSGGSGSRSSSWARAKHLHLDTEGPGPPCREQQQSEDVWRVLTEGPAPHAREQQQSEDVWRLLSGSSPQGPGTVGNPGALAGDVAPALGSCTAAAPLKPLVPLDTLHSKLQAPSAVPGVSNEHTTAPSAGQDLLHGAAYPGTGLPLGKAPDAPRLVTRPSPPDPRFDPRLPVLTSPCHSHKATPIMRKPSKEDDGHQHDTALVQCKQQIERICSPTPPQVEETLGVKRRGATSLWACCFRG